MSEVFAAMAYFAFALLLIEVIARKMEGFVSIKIDYSRGPHQLQNTAPGPTIQDHADFSAATAAIGGHTYTTTTTSWSAENHVGTCGACGGRVMQNAIWYTTHPPTMPPKKCEQCGRTAKEPPPPSLPVLEMCP